MQRLDRRRNRKYFKFAFVSFPHELLGKKINVPIFVGREFFEKVYFAYGMGDNEVISVLYDHEYESHVKDHYNGMEIGNYKIDHSNIDKIKEGEFEAIAETRAYNTQLSKIILKQRKVNDDFLFFNGKRYQEYYEKLSGMKSDLCRAQFALLDVKPKLEGGKLSLIYRDNIKIEF